MAAVTKKEAALDKLFNAFFLFEELAKHNFIKLI